MRFTHIAAMAIALMLCSFMLPEKGGRMPLNKWKYGGLTFHADTVEWSTANSNQMDFLHLDSAGRKTGCSISARFSKWPVPPGTYKLTFAPMKGDEVSITAADRANVYISRPCEDCTAHVEMKDGKLHIWSDKVLMNVGPEIKQGADADTTVLSFNLEEE